VSHPRNLTRFKTLDAIAADPRVEKVWDEGADGVWLHLAPGWNFEGQAGVRGETVKELIALFQLVSCGDPS